MIKNRETGLNVLEILKLLIKEDMTGDELAEKLFEINQKEFSAETLLRYINTLKYTGINITKSNKTGKYHLESQPFIVGLEDSDLKTISFIENYVNNLGNHEMQKEFADFFNNLSKFFSDDLKKKYNEIKQTNFGEFEYNYKSSKDKINIFEGLCRNKQKIEIEYRENKNTEYFIIEPIEVVYDKNCVYLLGYIPKLACNKNFFIENIYSYKELPLKAVGGYFLNTAVFECSERLAKNYKLKPSERIINSSEQSVIISNAQEDREALLRRILKYGENAKILQPKSLREEMINTLDGMIKNLEREE